MPSPSTQPAAAVHRALASSLRRRLLDVIRESEQPVTSQDLAATCEIHVTTVRWHLDQLEMAGLVVSKLEPSGRPGRPPVVWSAQQELNRPDPTSVSHRLLATILVDGLMHAPTGDDVSAWAQELGERWGPKLLASMRLADEGDPHGSVMSAFDELGFAPESTPDTIRLHACPFADIARGNEEIVCDLHLGIARSMLRSLHADVATGELEPFVEPSLCVLSLVPAA